MSKGEAFNHKNSVPAIKHISDSIMLWGCFDASGAGSLYRVDGIMKQAVLSSNFSTSTQQVDNWVFQQVNDPRNISRLVL